MQAKRAKEKRRVKIIPTTLCTSKGGKYEQGTLGVGFIGYDPPHLLFSSRVQRVQNAGVYGRRPAAPTNKVANIFFPKLRDKNTQQKPNGDKYICDN